MKDIKGYEGLYAVTSCGRVWSYSRNRFLKPYSDKDGYLRVGLSKNREVKFFLIHRLVALAYIPNTKKLPEVNHRSEIKTQNYYKNLEWCSHRYNMNYGTRTERAKTTLKNNPNTKRGVYCLELNEVFYSVSEAAKKYGLDQGSISKCCYGKREYCGRHPITKERLHWMFIL